jgi:hypothetical protein
MSSSTILSAYSESGFSGKATVYDLDSSATYKRISSKTLKNDDLYCALSSMKLFDVGEGDVSLYVFYPMVPLFVPEDYEGLFLQVTARDGAITDVEDLAGYGANDLATSMLMVRTDTSKTSTLRFSVNTLFFANIKRIVDSAIKNLGRGDAEITRRGDIVISSCFFPTDVDGLDSDEVYIKTTVGLDLDLPWPLKTYSATLYFYVQLGIEEHTNTPIAELVQWDYWLESGSREYRVKAELLDGVRKIEPSLRDQVEGLVSGLPEVANLYLLPGTHTDRPHSGVTMGSSYSDVTIVAEL